MHPVLSRLSVPLVAAPMFRVSTPELVVAAARAGIVGAFPTLNARTAADLDGWLERIARETADAPGLPAANLILHASNARRDDDLHAVVRHRVPVVIASVGAPDRVIGPVHGYGGLVLLTAGAGGNTGWMNPFAFVAEVRRFFDGIVAVAGSVTEGRQLHALQVAGADDVLVTDAVTGIPASFVRGRLRELGWIDAKDRATRGGTLDIAGWKPGAWSAG